MKKPSAYDSVEGFSFTIVLVIFLEFFHVSYDLPEELVRLHLQGFTQ